MIPASSGTQEMVDLEPQQHAGLINAFDGLIDDLNVLVTDTAVGIFGSVISLVRASQEALRVVCDEPSLITCAYVFIKNLLTDHGVSHFPVVADVTRSPVEGQNLFRLLESVTSRILDVGLIYACEIPFNEFLRKSVKRQRVSVGAFTGRKSYIAYRKLSKDLPSGRLKSFVERLVSKPAGTWLGGEDCNLRRDD